MSNLFTLKICNRRGATLGFLFDDEAQAIRNYDDLKAALKGPEFEDAHGLAPSLNSGRIEIRDNFGSFGVIDLAEVAWYWITNVGKELEGQKQMALLQAHAQANLQRMQQADPLLRAAPPRGQDLGSFISHPPRN